MENRIKIGISSCLLGENVRWNGGHKLDRYLTQTLGQFLEFVPVCPEVEAGFGIPRETMRLEGHPQSPRLVTSRTKVDHTERMLEWAKKRVEELSRENLCGFIFKSSSPSSGLMRVKVYNSKGMPEKKGVGLFARAFTERFPRLPVEEDGRLHDPKLRENFIEQIFTLRRWRELFEKKLSMGNLVDFHSRHKLLIMSHSPDLMRIMGKLVSGKNTHLSIGEIFDAYEENLMAALRLKTTEKKNINVLQHMMGYFKKQLSADEKQELLDILDQYRSGHVPLIVPNVMINHYVRKYDEPYLKHQVYLNPHPVALKLRNHV